MHILFIVIILALAAYFILKNNQTNHYQSAEMHPQKPLLDSIPRQPVAFLSRGKLFFHQDNETQQIHSPYVQAVIDRVERKKALHGWKENTAFGTSYTGGLKPPVANEVDIQFSAAVFTTPEKLVYFLSDSQMGGIFEYNVSTKEEKRLLHKQNLMYRELAINLNAEKMLYSQVSNTGGANIGISNLDGSDARELTGGDTLDSSPCWIGNENKLLFQSSGIARNEHGYLIAYGPSSILMMDIDSHQLNTILESDDIDYLSPKVAPDGALYFIKRPYEAPKYSGSHFLIDFVLFPFRVLRTLFHYLNFMSLVYSKKPLTSASGPKVQADLKELILKGKRINAEKALQSENRINGIPSLVPKSWQLIRKDKDGQETVIATNVATFDIKSDGSIIYSNGFGTFLLQGDGSQLMFESKLIEEISIA